MVNPKILLIYVCIAYSLCLFGAENQDESERKGVCSALCSENNQDRVKDCCVYSCCFFPWICFPKRVLNWLSTYHAQEAEKRRQRQVMRVASSQREDPYGNL